MAIRVYDLEQSEDDLLAQAQAGSEAAFGELYRLHHDRLLRFCTYRLGDRHEAQDVVQEVFARAWNKLPTFVGGRPLYPWLRVIAANLCTDIHRRRSRTDPVAEVVTAPVDGGQERLIDEVDAALVRQAMGRLKPRHRTALEMRERDGLSYEQIALGTGVSLGTVESLLWRARQALKREFTAVGGEGALAGIPVVGWAIRRLRATGGRFNSWLSRHGLNQFMSNNALAGALVGAAVASVLSAGIAEASPAPATTPGAAPSAWSVSVPGVSAAVPAPARPAPTTTTAPRATAASGATSRPSSGRPGGHSLQNPVHWGEAPAAHEASQDLIHVSAGGVTAGVDPKTTVGFVKSLIPTTGAGRKP
ncbi:MAG TPA: RNA polymerase sigma factor [Acidimicrobiales bacterium]|nr:RNA polymerase sigma factor [Acidimicrobiales bacterium]